MFEITHRKAFYSCLFTLLIVSLYSCTQPFGEVNKKEVFRYNEHKNISSLDPAFAKDLADINVMNQLFNGLIQLDDSLRVTPCIAKSWTVDQSGLVYTFTLRNDVWFHEHEAFGGELTRTVKSSDFVYSFNRIIDERIASPGRWIFKNVERFWAVNDSLLKIQLTQPMPYFLGMLSMKYTSVVPKEIVEWQETPFRSRPIGTGPFKFKRWIENTKLVLRKNKLYFEKDENNHKLPYLEAIAITFLPDKQSEFLQFVQGNIDYVSGLDDSYKDEILSHEGELKTKFQEQVNLLRSPYLNTEYLGFYLDSEIPELQSKLFRKAINLGFDRKKMMRYLRNGIGIPAQGGFIPKGLSGHNQKGGFQFNPEEAKKLIEQFKVETGILNPKITLTTTSNYLSFCEYIQSEVKNIGVEIQIDVMPPASLREAKANGKLDAFRASWVADYPDAENYLSLFFSQNFAPFGPNYTHFNLSDFDALYVQSLRETDLNKRTKMYQKMDSLIISQAPIVVLFYDEVIRFSQENVKGLGINPINILNLKRVYKNGLREVLIPNGNIK